MSFCLNNRSFCLSRKVLSLGAAMLLSLLSVSAQSDKVEMLMGVRGGSNCVVGPQLPHGSINPSPQTDHGGHGGYKENQPIRGFGQLHVSGTGWGRYGQLLLSPQRGFTAVENGHDSDKADEVITPYYYKVRLTRYDILTEIAPSAHSAAYRFTYYEGYDKATLLFDVAHNLSQHIVPEQHGEYLGGNIQYDPRSQTLGGYGEYRGGFGSSEPYKVYFALWSSDFNLQNAQIGSGGPVVSNESTLGSAIPGDADISAQSRPSALFAKIMPYHDDEKPKILYIAVSLNSVENAREYLQTECVGKGFDGIKDKAQVTWDEALGKIRIDASEDEQRLFYTTLYHSMVMPRDRSNDNPRFYGDNIDDHYCIWDTWRTGYPLLTLLDEPFVSKTIRSFILRYQEDGKCTPTFTSSLEWDWRQGGDDVENVIADAFVKGVGDFDRQEAYEWLKWSATNNRSKEYQRLGWQPEVDTLMSCSNAVEYAYNDYCVYQAAKIMKDKKFAKQMLRRSHSWQKLFNPAAKDDEAGIYGFIQPRRESGEWCKAKDGKAFSPNYGYGSWVEYFYEGNSWTYSLFTPHDFKTLIKLSGGKQKMIERLEYGFDKGLIALWNEPGFLSPFIFHHCNRPDLTARYVGQLRSKNYSIERGYCDNEDSGAMGSWFVFTSLGFFPNAGQDYYYLLPPAYPKATVILSNGRTLTIQRDGNGTAVKEIRLNGKRLKNSTIKHADLIKGGTLLFTMQ